jgi:leucyl-tRNA synthetase
MEIREIFEGISKEREVSKDTLEKSLKLLAPFCPHLAEELWEKLGHEDFISLAEWPKAKEIKQEKSKEDLNERVITHVKEILEKVGQEAKKAFIYVMPFELNLLNKEKIEKGLEKPVEIFAVNDPKKIDPENKSKKALPGKPGVYLE